LQSFHQDWADFLRFRDLHFLRKDQVCFQFLQAALSEAQELDEFAGILPAVPLRDVGWHRARRAPDLACEPEQLFPGETAA
jgi:hypothetical protein